MAFLMDAVLILFMIGIIILYAKRGAVKSVYGLLTTVVACLAAFFLGPVIGSSLIKPFLGGTEDAVFDALMPIVESVEGAFDIGALFDSIPKEFSDLIARCGADLDSLKESFGTITAGTEADVRELAQVIAGPVTEYVSKALGCVALYLIATIVMLILKGIILPVIKLPLIKQADGLLGAVIGVISAFAYAWIICIALSAFVEFGLLGEYNETLGALAEKSFLFRFFCGISPLDLINITSVF